MAASTAVTISLQTKDWELLIGIIFQSADSEMIDAFQQLAAFYKAAVTKPLQTDVIAVVSTESVVIKLSAFLYGNTVMNVTKDIGGSPFNRIMAALRALNNIADNYISTTLAANDVNYLSTLTAIKKYGRQYIMNRQYDNN